MKNARSILFLAATTLAIIGCSAAASHPASVGAHVPASAPVVVPAALPAPTSTTVAPAPVAAPVAPAAKVQEDDPAFNCATMGNRICGPVTVKETSPGAFTFYDGSGHVIQPTGDGRVDAYEGGSVLCMGEQVCAHR